MAIGFIADVGNAFDLLVAHHLGDAFNHRGLVHLIGKLGDDDGFALFADFLDLDLAAHHDRAAARVICGFDARSAENDAAGWEVWAGHDLDQAVDGDFRVINGSDAGVDYFAKIVRRNVGGHADGNAACPVHQQIGEAGGKDHGLAFGIVVVRLKINRVLVNVIEQRVG